MIIVIEGADQAGKFTQSTLLYKALKKRGIKAKLFDFPDYATPTGQNIKKCLNGRKKIPHQVIHCLLSANRWEKLDEIMAAKEKNSVLIMNRYYHSNMVYGKANGLKQKWLENLDEGLPKADLVILLDITQEESFNRQKTHRDNFEKNKEFLDNISKIYRNTAKKKRWKTINAVQSREQIQDQILGTVLKKTELVKTIY